MATEPEKRALAHVAERAARSSDAANASIARLLNAAALAEQGVRSIVDSLQEHARVTLNFHPDRLRPDGVSVAEGLLRDGLYRSQFDTGVTNGSPTAFAGGERDRWEEQLFGRAYHDGNAQRLLQQERPKYGAFNVMAHPDGASPRFGSCYLELSRSILPRCSFTWGDSHQGPEHVGTLARFETVLAAWFETVDATGAALGIAELDVPALIARLSNPHRGIEPLDARPPGRALDDYIEAQVHGPIALERDVAALIIDPSFDDTETGEHLVAIAARYGIALRRHAGFVLRPEEVPSDFRGPRMPPLAQRLARDAEIDAATLGRAARSLFREPEKWQDWASPAETWQHIKQLWHVLVRFGRAASST